MDAAPSLWRPLGEMLVDRGLLTREELDDVLATQKESGRKLGEIIVDRGYISGPTLALTLAEQWGVELTSDEGFGTGLRTEIQRRHEGERQRRPDLHAVAEPELKGHEIFASASPSDGVLAEVEALLADDDARIVQLEARLSQHAEDRAQQQAHIEEVVAAETARIEKALMDETAKLAEKFSLTQKDLLAAAADWRAKHEGQIVKLLADKLGRLEAGMKETQSGALSEADKRFLERRVGELVTHGLKDTRKQLLDALSAKLAAFEVPAPDAPSIDLTGFEKRIANLVDEKLGALQIPAAVHETVDLGAIEKLLDERFEALDLPQPVQQTVDLTAHERWVANLIEQKLGELEFPAPVQQTVDLTAHEQRVAKLMDEKLLALELPAPVQQTVDLTAHEHRVAKLIEKKLGELELPAPVQQTVDLSAHEQRVAKLMDEKLSALELPASVQQTVDLTAHEHRVADLIEEKLGQLEFPAPVQQTVDLAAHERRVAELIEQKLGELEFPVPVQQTVDLTAHEKRMAELMDEKLSALELPAPVHQSVDLTSHEQRIAQTVAKEVARMEKSVLQGAAKSDEKLAAANSELVEKIDKLAAALESISRRNKGDRLERMSGDLHATVKRLDRLEELVRSSTNELLDRLKPPPPPVPATPESEPMEDEPAAFNEHLVFAPGKSGYALITVELPPPVVGAEVSLGNGERYQVTKVADSPFPRDERPCAYLQRVS